MRLRIGSRVSLEVLGRVRGNEEASLSNMSE